MNINNQKQRAESSNRYYSKTDRDAEDDFINCYHQPKIDEYSKSLAKRSNRFNTPVYERLFEDSNSPKVSAEKIPKPKLVVKPKKLCNNPSEASLRLYEDAKTRDRIAKCRIEAMKKTHKGINTAKYVADKFLDEFNNCIKDMNIESEKEINLETMQELMVRMRLAPLHGKDEACQYELFISRMFEELDQENTGLVSLDQVKYFVAGIMNMKINPNRPVTETLRIHEEYKFLYFFRKLHCRFTMKPIIESSKYTNTKNSLIKKQNNSRPKTYRNNETKNLKTEVRPNKISVKKNKETPSRQRTTGVKKALDFNPKPEPKKKEIKKERTKEIAKEIVKESNFNPQLQRKPLLRIQIDLGTHSEEVIFYKGDTVESLAEEFAESHSILL